MEEPSALTGRRDEWAPRTVNLRDKRRTTDNGISFVDHTNLHCARPIGTLLVSCGLILVSQTDEDSPNSHANLSSVEPGLVLVGRAGSGGHEDVIRTVRLKSPRCCPLER